MEAMSSEKENQAKHIRYERLQIVCDKALEESQKVLTDENLYSCYPSLSSTKEGKELIQVVKDQLIETWTVNSKNEFDAIFKERDIESKLNELDELISEAQIRQKESSTNKNEEAPILFDQLTPSTILASHLLPVKERNLKSLQAQLKELQSGNLELFNELNSLLKESHTLKDDISTNLNSIRTLNELANESDLDNKLNNLIKITQTETDIT